MGDTNDTELVISEDDFENLWNEWMQANAFYDWIASLEEAQSILEETNNLLMKEDSLPVKISGSISKYVNGDPNVLNFQYFQDRKIKG